MKGTIKRGLNPQEDSDNAKRLQNSSKERAENAMITDIIRNDLGKICDYGSVEVVKKFEVEPYPTLFQMTSTVSGTVKNPQAVDFKSIFAALLPAASVTGAPKQEAVKHISRLETTQRGVYTGIIGFIDPDQNAIFNVAIRTLQLKNTGTEKTGKYKASLGIGSGVVYDSEGQAELKECLLKSNFIFSANAKQAQDNQKTDNKTKNTSGEFYLFETMLLKNSKIRLKKLHLDRLKKSAKEFGFTYPEEEICRELDLLTDLRKASPLKNTWRIKLSLFSDGKFSLNKQEETFKKKRYRIIIAKSAVSSGNFFARHKTGYRKFFDQMSAEARRQGYDEVLFLNELGFATECCFHNIMVKINNRWISPPQDAGLLPGTMREYLLRKKILVEKDISLEEIKEAGEIAIMNSLRGINRAYIDYEKSFTI